MAGFGFGKVGFVGSLSGAIGAAPLPGVPVAPYVADDDTLIFAGYWVSETGHAGPFNGVIRYAPYAGVTATSRTIYGRVFSFWVHDFATVGAGLFEVLRASDNAAVFSITLPNAAVSNITSTKHAESPFLPLDTYYCRFTTQVGYSSIDAFYCSA